MPSSLGPALRTRKTPPYLGTEIRGASSPSVRIEDVRFFAPDMSNGFTERGAGRSFDLEIVLATVGARS